MTTMQWSRPMDTCPWSPTAGPSCAKSPGACAGITATKGRLALLGAPGTSTANKCVREGISGWGSGKKAFDCGFINCDFTLARSARIIHYEDTQD